MERLPWKTRLQWRNRYPIRRLILRGSRIFRDLPKARHTTAHMLTTTHTGIAADQVITQKRAKGAIARLPERSIYRTVSSTPSALSVCDKVTHWYRIIRPAGVNLNISDMIRNA